MVFYYFLFLWHVPNSAPQRKNAGKEKEKLQKDSFEIWAILCFDMSHWERLFV